MHIAQIAEGKPVSAAEVLKWCSDASRNQPRRINEAALNEFVELLNSHIEFRASTDWADYQNRKMKLPRPGPTLDLAYALRSNLDYVRRQLGDGFWIGLGAPLGGMEKLGAALAELGPFLRARPRGRRGRKRQVWHEFAAQYALFIADILESGSRPSLFTPLGPVAAVGVKAVKRVFGHTPRRHTFAWAVSDVLRGLTPNEIDEQRRMWRGRNVT